MSHKNKSLENIIFTLLLALRGFDVFFFSLCHFALLCSWIRGAHRSGSRERRNRIECENSAKDVLKRRHDKNEFIITHRRRGREELGYQINANILCTFKLNFPLTNTLLPLSSSSSRISVSSCKKTYLIHSVSLNFWASSFFRLCMIF